MSAIMAARKKTAARRERHRLKAARIAAARQITTASGESLTIPPRWKLRTAENVLTAELHAAIKARDGNVCISCGKPGLVVAFKGGTWHAGHLFAVGPYRGLRFHPLNISSQCSQCNSGAARRGGRLGNHAAYADAFIRRYGLATFQALADERNKPRKWTVGELYELLTILRRGGLTAYQERYFALTGWNQEKAA